MMNTKWRDEQHPSFINFIASFLSANSFRLNFVPIAPVILAFLNLFSIFTCTGTHNKDVNSSLYSSYVGLHF